MMLSQSSTCHGLRAGGRHQAARPLCATIRRPVAGSRTPLTSQHGRSLTALGASSVGNSTQTAEQDVPANKAAKGSGVVFSIDDTPGASDALAWGIENVVRPGERILLVHVVCDTRSPHTSVAVSRTGMASYDALDMAERISPDRQAYERRIHKRAEQVVEERAGRLLAQAGIEYEVQLPLQPGATSAATIGDAICQVANGSRLLVVASHGPGVLAEFGSVARYTYQHSPVPLALVPPSEQEGGMGSSNVVVLAVQGQEELGQCLEYALGQLLRAGDKLHIVQACASPAESLTVAPELQQQLHAKGVDDVEVSTVHEADVDARGQKVCELAASLQARAVAMVHYASRGYLQELMSGSLASYVSRHSARPTILIGM